MDGASKDGAATTVARASDRLERAYVLVIDGSSSQRVALPDRGDLVVGRGDGADLRLDDTSVSRRHLLLRVRAGEVTAVDLGSQNGTTINGERLRGERVLGARDVIAAGDATLIVSVPGAARPSASAPSEPRLLALGRATALIADPAMDRLYAQIERVAASDLPVLLGGETGVGKELAALAVHSFSRRRGGPFVALNCAALPENLIESELFGHERGAFSGAVAAKPGLLEAARGGTLFLDEIRDMPPAAQAKLLRALETRRVTHLGDVVEREIDLRLVAATNADLEAEVKAGRFRQDLYFRLRGVRIWLPPLRDRPRELALLAVRFLEDSCAEMGRAAPPLSPAAVALLARHGWPGNVRELRHAMAYAATSLEPAAIAVEPRHLPEELQQPAGPGEAPAAPTSTRPLADEMRDLERSRIVEALRSAGGNKTRAAALIGMPRRTFAEKLRQHGLAAEKDRP